MFTTEFASFACVGDKITCEVDGFEVRATIEDDHDTRPQDNGFDPDDKDYGAENRKICDAWSRDEWHYSGVVLSVWRAGVCLTDHGASLWAVERNFPGADNTYLRTVANEMLAEALDAGKATLAKLCASA